MMTLIPTLILALMAQASAPAAPGTVQGIVCEVVTCKPVAGARVVVSTITDQGPSKPTVTDLTGTFRFQQMPPGRYQLEVEADNYVTATIVGTVNLTEIAGVDGIRVEMRPLGTISGRALDEAGEPLVGARVEVLAARTQGRVFSLLTVVAAADTDDRGQYRISSLEPDEYCVRVVPSDQKQHSFPTTYYPSTTEPATAAKLVVSGGEDIGGIDPKLPTHGVRVRGRLVFPEKQTGQVLVTLLSRTLPVLVVHDLNPNYSDQTSDDFEIRGVPPGSYYLFAVSRNNLMTPWSYWVRYPLEVGDKDLEDVTVPLLRPGSIKGRVIIGSDATGRENVDLSSMGVTANSDAMVPGPPVVGDVFARPDKNGVFTIPRVPEMQLFIGDTGADWFVCSVLFNGNDAMSAGFSVKPGTENTLEITITNATGTLTGVIKDGQEKPVPGGRLALLPDASRRSNPFLVRTGVALEGGAFTIDAIPPGEYTVVALPDQDQFTPAFLRVQQNVEKYERYGERVHVGAHETTHIDLTVAPLDNK